MKIDHVPQDDIVTYDGMEKVIYATDEDGHYGVVASTGWSIEEEVTRQALLELTRLADEAYQEVISGKASPLYYYMYAKRMDLQLLSQATGLFQWRIKRHFKPGIFSRLDDAFLERYSDVLGLTVEALKSLPERDTNV
ncbi:MAG: hypothetical protein U9R26_04390 [Campylobacterota bacterium]|nr:hypothetical protein [Campylobacterota bacterium]